MSMETTEIPGKVCVFDGNIENSNYIGKEFVENTQVVKTDLGIFYTTDGELYYSVPYHEIERWFDDYRESEETTTILAYRNRDGDLYLRSHLVDFGTFRFSEGDFLLIEGESVMGSFDVNCERENVAIRIEESLTAQNVYGGPEVIKYLFTEYEHPLPGNELPDYPEDIMRRFLVSQDGSNAVKKKVILSEDTLRRLANNDAVYTLSKI